MTLKAKLLGAHAVLAVALALVGLIAIGSVRTLGHATDEILKDNYRSVLAAQRMKEAAERLDRAALFRVADRPDRADEQVAPNRATFEAELAVQQGNVTERGEADATARLRQAWDAYREASLRFEGLAGRPALEAAYFDDMEPRFQGVKAAAQEVLDLNQDAMVRRSERARAQARNLIALVVAATLGGLLAGTLLASGLTARIVRPVTVLALAAQRIATGDLTARARVAGKDEIAGLAREFNAMADRLAEYRQSSLGELLQAQQAAQATIDGLPDPVLILDLAGNLQNANGAAEALLRLGAGGSTAGPLAALDPALRAAVERVRAHVAAGLGPWQPRGFEDAVRLDGPDGTRWLLPRAAPLHAEGGGVSGAAVVLQDVTRLMRVDELKNDLVATVAHEFRTPLTSLRMAIHLCVEEAAGPVTEKQTDLLQAARQDCERLQGIVDDLLDLSRIQAGRVELVRRPVAPRTLLEDAATAARDAAEAAGVALQVRAEGLGVEVAADPDRLALVLSNLVSNALRHTPRGGRVTLGAASAGQAVRFEVADSGEGIPREWQERVFDRYFRVPGRRGGGVGLGLYLVRELVQAHGGEVGVESAPGEGSRFWFTVPLAAPGAGDGG
ncbi:MAG: HAMP domain-containing protein [Anaeromyxobacter sp.]|nr:HAMP domain-containing protein [Anaeromyxobacter sp.]MBL0276826.1 HAMP domain-containing protein [Anaeromyxobacter sp.]